MRGKMISSDRSRGSFRVSLTLGTYFPFIHDLVENSLTNCLKYRTKIFPTGLIQKREGIE